MLHLLTCAHGHFWESSRDTGASCPECGAPADVLPSPDLAPALPPTVAPAESRPAERAADVAVPGYDLLKELDRGPTGIRRYRAKQQQVNREVVVEVVLAREDPTQRAWSSLRSEAGLLGKLSHPHILRIHDAGERDREVFYNVVEHVSGPALSDLTQKAPLPVPQVLALVEALARAVEFAHQAGVYHRHLEPAAVLLQPVEVAEGGSAYRLHSGVYIPRIGGFGLARRPVEGDPTDTDLFVDPGYLAPEQAWGRVKEIGPATDVYGLGGIFYCLLTGRPPFRGPTLGDTLDAILTARLQPPSFFRGLSADVNEVCLAALERQPRWRYKSAGEFADDLRRLRTGVAPKHGSKAFGAGLKRWVARQPALATLLAVGALLGLFGICAGVLNMSDGPGSNGPGPIGRTAMFDLQNQLAMVNQEVAQARQQLRFAEYTKAIAFAGRALAGNHPEKAIAKLEACPVEERRFEWHYLLERANRRGRIHLAEGDGPQTALAYHPNLQGCLVTAREVVKEGETRGELRLYRLPARKATRLQSIEAGPVRGLAFASAGDALAVIAGEESSELRVFEMNHEVRREAPDFGPTRCVLPYRNKRLTSVAWSSTGRTMIAVTSSSGLVHWVESTGAALMRPAGEAPGAAAARTQLTFKPGTDNLFGFTSGGRQVMQWHSGSHEPNSAIPTGEVVQAIAFNPNGVLAVAVDSGAIQLYGAQPNPFEAPERIDGVPRGVFHLAFSPDGTRLAMATKAAVHVWGMAGTSWEELLVFPADATMGLAFSPQGKSLATSGARQVVVWGVAGE